MASSFHVSPSQLDTFLHCQRKWAWDYIANLKGGDNEYSIRGKKVHKILEDWTQFATAPDLGTLFGRIAYPALQHIPPPMTQGVKSEERVEWTSPAGNIWVFLKDLEQTIGRQVAVTDYKTTSNLAYAKTPETLCDIDPQGIVYAYHAFTVRRASVVTLKWLYLTANKPHRCLPVIVQPNKQTNAERFRLLDEIASVMIGHRQQATNPLAFPPSPSYCGAFGGCPHKARCNLSDREKFDAIMNTQPTNAPNTAGFLASIAGIAKGAPVATPQPNATPTPPAPKPWDKPASVAPAAPAASAAPVAPVVTTPAPVAASKPWLRTAAPVPSPAVQEEQPFPEPLPEPNETAHPATVPAPAPVPTAEQPMIAKRTRKAKTTAEKDFVPGQGWDCSKAPQVTDEPVKTAVDNEIPDLIDAPWKDADGSNRHIQNIEAPDDRLFELVVAMAQNPGYAGLDSVALVSKAQAILAAVRGEG